MDWADELADEMLLYGADSTCAHFAPAVAAALRKAKADGAELMRQKAIEGIEMRADRDSLTELVNYIRQVEV